MALIIKKPTQLGVDANYWRIPSYCYNSIDKKEFSCIVHAHIDEGTFLKGAKPLEIYDFIVRYEVNGDSKSTALYFGMEPRLQSDGFPFPAELDRIYLYELLRNNVPFFIGAENG